MQASISRRSFLQKTTVAAGLCGAATVSTHAISPFERLGQPRMPSSLAAYSVRQFFGASRGREQNVDPDKKITMFDFIDYCAERGLDGTELTSYFFPADADEEYFLRIRRHAFLKGLAISGTAVGNTFTPPPGEKREQEIAHVKQWIDYAQIMGAPHIRVFAGSAEGSPHKKAMKRCIAGLEECCDYAGQKGVFLGIENHGGIVAEADPLLEIVRSVQSPWVGINLDTGNFHTDDPYGDMAKCAPYTVNVQVKVKVRPRGGSSEEADLDRLVSILRDANYQGYVVLEYEAKEDPWVAIPRYLDRLIPVLEG